MSNNEIKNVNEHHAVATAIEPWLSVSNGAQAVEFYKKAFGAIEVYHLESPDGAVVAKLTVDDAGFWLSGEAPEEASPTVEPAAGNGSVRMILTVADPDALFARAIDAGGLEVFPVGEEYGWRLGRLTDPYGHTWEVGRPL